MAKNVLVITSSNELWNLAVQRLHKPDEIHVCTSKLSSGRYRPIYNFIQDKSGYPHYSFMIDFVIIDMKSMKEMDRFDYERAGKEINWLIEMRIPFVAVSNHDVPVDWAGILRCIQNTPKRQH